MEVLVDYADTDAMAVVHHAQYFRYLERARVAWLEHEGHSYRELEREGYALPLISAQIEYKKPLRFADRARVRVLVEKFTAATIDLSYEVLLGEELCTRATTHHVLCKKVVLENGTVQWNPT